MFKYKHSELGHGQKLDVRKGGVGIVVVWEAQLNKLAGYLNRAGNPGSRRVLEVIHLMQELESIEPPAFSEQIEGPMLVARAGRSEINPASKKIAPQKYHLQLRIDGLLRSINKRLARYRCWPYVLPPHAGTWVVMWSPRKPGARYEMGELQALEDILNLARAGYLNRLRRCVRCHNWLYAKFRHQNFCSSKCQQKRYTETEEFKAKRRGYMQEYYRKHFSAKAP